MGNSIHEVMKNKREDQINFMSLVAEILRKMNRGFRRNVKKNVAQYLNIMIYTM